MVVTVGFDAAASVEIQWNRETLGRISAADIAQSLPPVVLMPKPVLMPKLNGNSLTGCNCDLWLRTSSATSCRQSTFESSLARDELVPSSIRTIETGVTFGRGVIL